VLVPIVATSVLMVVGLSYQVLAVVFTTDVLADGVTSVGGGLPRRVPGRRSVSARSRAYA
jgi:hypothetical protein